MEISGKCAPAAITVSTFDDGGYQKLALLALSLCLSRNSQVHTSGTNIHINQGSSNSTCSGATF
jgi:hypothetical protein